MMTAEVAIWGIVGAAVLVVVFVVWSGMRPRIESPQNYEGVD